MKVEKYLCPFCDVEVNMDIGFGRKACPNCQRQKKFLQMWEINEKIQSRFDDYAYLDNLSIKSVNLLNKLLIEQELEEENGR